MILHVCVGPIVMVSMFFQPEGGTPCITKAEVVKEKEMLACGTKVHRLGEVVLVSKTHIFSLNLLPLSGAVW